MTPTITIFLALDMWHADMEHATGAAEIEDLFGTYILPTPFTAKTDVITVSQDLAQRNPGHEILVPF